MSKISMGIVVALAVVGLVVIVAAAGRIITAQIRAPIGDARGHQPRDADPLVRHRGLAQQAPGTSAVGHGGHQ